MDNNDLLSAYNMGREFNTANNSLKEEKYYSNNAGETKVINILALAAVVLFATMLFIPKHQANENLIKTANSSLNMNPNMYSKSAAI
jgi:hypothetical protein